jgi:hypothetical protein
VRTKKGSAATKMVIVYVHTVLEKNVSMLQFVCLSLFPRVVVACLSHVHFDSFFTLIHGQIVEEDAVGVLELGVLRDHD